MARGIGRALQRAVSREGLAEESEGEGRGLANARRRQVFRHLCLRPCARVGTMGRELSMSQANVRWHIWDLVENGYLQFEGARVFPVGLIDPEDAALFAVLASAGRAEILTTVFQSPGTSLQELAERVQLTRQSASKIAQELSEFGCLTTSDDGRYRRVYPTNALVRKREANRERADAFSEALLRRLAEEGLDPELLRREETTFLVRFAGGSRKVVLEVPVDPYVTAWMRPG